MNWTLEDICTATGGALVLAGKSQPIGGISTDSRTLAAGELYVPLVGARFDGHAFISDAVAQGASAILSSRDLEEPLNGAALIRVTDTLAAYGDLARAHRERFHGPVVAITGSSGKTSTKELVASLLGLSRRVHRTTANHNNEIGVPRTLLGIEPHHEAVVVEMGMRGQGEIAYLTSVARPTIGIVTHIGTAHIGRLGSQDAIARAKGELFRVGGPTLAAVVNADDPRSLALGHEHPGPVATFSLHDSAATVHAEGEGKVWLARWKAGPLTTAGSVIVELPFEGDHHRANALAALATAWHLGELPRERWVPDGMSLPGRSRVLHAGEITIWDETYNANPESMKATLRAIVQGAGLARCIAVLGDMGELGSHEEAGHLAVGATAREVGIAHLVTVGNLGEAYARGYQGPCTHTPSGDEALRALVQLLQPGDRVLVKASRAMQLESLVESLVQHLDRRVESNA